MGVPYEGDVWDFYVGKARVKAALPVGTILTIPRLQVARLATVVITNEEGWYKKDSLLIIFIQYSPF